MLIKDLLEENNRRKDDMYKRFNPRTGEGSVGERAFVSSGLPDKDAIYSQGNVPEETDRQTKGNMGQWKISCFPIFM